MSNYDYFTLLFILFILTVKILINGFIIDNIYIGILINLVLFSLVLTLTSLFYSWILVVFIFFFITFDLILIYYYVYNKFSLSSLKII